MRYKDVIKLNVQRFKNRKLRVALTIFGVGVGIGIVYFLVSLVFGIQNLVIGKLVTSDSLLTLDITLTSGTTEVLKLDNEFIKGLEAMESVESVSPQKSFQGQIELGSLRGQSTVLSVKPDFFSLSGLEPLQGSFFVKEDEQAVVLNTQFLELFKVASEEIIGERIQISVSIPADGEDPEAQPTVIEFNDPFTVIGVIESTSNSLYIPYKHVQSEPKMAIIDPILLKVKASDESKIKALKDEITSQGFRVTALTETLDQLNRIFGVTRIMFGTVGVVALFISAVGMFNTMTISLLERTREVGIMKSIGATSKDIWSLFLFDSILMGFLGGVTGILLGWLTALIFNFAINQFATRLGGNAVDLFDTPVWFFILVIGTSLLMGLLTGLYPARRAAKIDPLDALRYE